MPQMISDRELLADMAKDVEIDRKTADGWLSVLVSSGLVCYLTLWSNPRALELSAMSGAVFENYVVSEIIKGYVNHSIDVRSRLCYYRDNNGKEIDLLILENGRLYPIEIKKSADPGKGALKNFSVLNSLAEETGEGAIICMTPMVIPLDEKNCLVPTACI